MQLLVTLEDGRQVGIWLNPAKPDSARVVTRSVSWGCWGPPLPEADTKSAGTAHLPGTYHIGEW